MDSFEVKYKNGAFYNCSAQWEWVFGPMLDHDLWVVLSGSGVMKVNSHSYNISCGSAFLLPPDCVGCASHDPDDPLRVVAIHFDFIDKRLLRDYLHCHLEQLDFIRELMDQAIIAGGNKDYEEAGFWLSAALRKILPRTGNGTSQRYAREINSLCTRIINHPRQSFNVVDMAAELCLCKDHFTRIFKNIKGTAPNSFVVNSRVEYARSLLLNSNMSIQEIADELNYSSVYFFCRQFKQKTGLSPAACRKHNIR